MKTDFNKSFIKAKKVATNVPFVSVRLVYDGEVTLKIGCESDFAVYDSGEFIFSGAYSAPYGSVAYDCFGFSGKGFLDLIFCKFPRGSSIYKSGKTMFIYELTDEKGNVVAFSDEGNDVFYREDIFYPDYAITAQIGWSFAYDLSAKPQKKAKTIKTVLSSNESLLLPRPVKKCFFTKKMGVMLEKGNFVFSGGKTPAEKIEAASLAKVDDGSASLKKGQYAVFDLGEETTGQIFFDITAENSAGNPDGNSVYVGYGEDFKGRVHAYINGRNFAFSYKLNGGENKFVQPFGRMGGRYLVLFALCDISVREIGVLEIGYPVTKKALAFKDPLDQKIYDVAARTNYLCMHSHYEDCPWREQAFYGMDAALQMKYAYAFFGETTFPRENLRLFYSTQRGDGLFELCAPSEIGTTIPSFSLFAAMALADYYDFSGDEKFVSESRGAIEKLLDAFIKRLDKELIARFFEKKYWNFYEWKTDLDGGDIFRNEDQEPIIDLPLNALLAMTLYRLGRLFDGLEIANDYVSLADKIREKLDEKFYDEDSKAFYCFSYNGRRWGQNELCETLMLAIGSKHSGAAAKNIVGERFEPVTTAFFGIKAEALICYDKSLKNYVYDKIRAVFGKMIRGGATSFYETEKGKEDFESAGSLCHAWASAPAYLYVKYFTELFMADAAYARQE
ncbi:MAG: hypothetical protein SOT09_01455 [Candidatus Borkfalkiaceae bacterium]|nr:hypothetical protein [Christensenellaceae bacterium]